MTSNSVSRREELLEAAINYARLGFPVFPLHHITEVGMCSCGNRCSKEGKHPRTSNGLNDATTDPATIRQFWQYYPLANVGLRTGAGIGVLDIDPKNGGTASLSIIENRLGKIPTTPTVKTGGGGSHFFFKYDKEIRNRTGVYPGVDFRGDGGYVVASPSNHKSGYLYNWEEARAIGKIEIAPMPPALRLILTDKTDNSRKADEPELFSEGQRNDGLMRVAGRLVRSGLGHAELCETLLVMNQTRCTPALDDNEVRQIATSASRYIALPIEWAGVLALPNLQPEVPELRREMIPDVLGSWAWDLSERMQCPPEFAVIPVLVSLSSLIGGRTVMRPKQFDNWTEAANLWGMIISPPGAMKTPCQAEALRPINLLQSEAMRKFQTEMKAYTAEEIASKVRIEALKSKSKGVDAALAQKLKEELDQLSARKPLSKRFIVNDATTEKIGEILHDNKNGILLFRDEIFGFLMGLEKKGHEGARALFLESWSGQNPFTYDRIGRGTVHIERLCISILGGIQPDRLMQYFNQTLIGGASDDGLLARFQLMVWPKALTDFKLVDREPDKALSEKLEQIFRKIISWDEKESEHGLLPFAFEPDAQQLFNYWYEAFQKRLRLNKSGSMAFQAHLSKFGSLMISLATIFQVVESLVGKENQGDVSLQSAKMAIGMCDYFESHARKVYASTIHPDRAAAEALAKKIATREIYDGIPIREICRKQWASLDSSEFVRSGLSFLEKHNWIRIVEVPAIGKQGGASSEIVRLNPQIKVPSTNSVSQSEECV
jgi:hypothetical protein